MIFTTFEKALNKIITILEEEDINYMIVGGLAVSYHNRSRTTNDIDLVVQTYPHDVEKIINHFPEWKDHKESFVDSVKFGSLFNITDFETGIRYDFITYKDSDYNYRAFQRREKVEFFSRLCWMISIEDLIISKIQWYNISQSEKQLEDLKFLLLDSDLDIQYIKSWIFNLQLKTYGLLGK